MATYIQLITIPLIFDPTQEEAKNGIQKLPEDDQDIDVDDHDEMNTFAKEYYFDFGTEENFNDYGDYYYEAILDFIQPHLPGGYYYDQCIEPVSGPHELSSLPLDTLIVKLPPLRDVPSFNLNYIHL